MRQLGAGYDLRMETEGERAVLRARAFYAPSQMRVTLTFPVDAAADLTAFKARLVRAPAGREGP